MNTSTLNMLAILYILFTAIPACATEYTQDDKLKFQSDARNFCNVFMPSVWSEMKKSYQGPALMNEFLRRVDEAVTTPEFEAIMDQQHTVNKNADSLYEYYVIKVTALTGQKFSCPDLKTYFIETLR